MAQINKPTDYFNTLLHTGDGTDGRAITGVGFQPDWCWFKARNTAYENQVYDVVRGATKRLVTNDTTAEGTQANGLQSFDSDGFTVGNANGTNVNAVTYASWNWLASNTTASNTDGSITSTVSANTTSGFSIVSYTGTGSVATVGHGLGSVPKMIIIKKRNSATGSDWFVYHVSNGNDSKIWLNQTSAKGTDTHMNNTTPTSSVFSIGARTEVNNSGDTYIAYCFAEVKGFSKFGSYVGNGNADGTFIYTGFKPAFVMIKNSSSAGAWYMQDNKRDIDNPIALSLNASDSNADNNQGNIMDFLSNGIKIRNTGTGYNTSGGTYIYMAFAEEPLVGDNPATAR